MVLVDTVPANQRYLEWHGNCMLFAAIVLLPCGIFIARYLKETWIQSSLFSSPMWNIAHILYMSSGVMFLTLGLLLTSQFRNNRENVSRAVHAHEILGWVAIIILGFQYILGILTNKAEVGGVCHSPLRILHWMTGIFGNFLTILVTMGAGSLQDARFPYFASGVIFIWMIFGFLMHAYAAYSLHEQDKMLMNKEEAGFRLYYRTFLLLPVPNLEILLPGRMLRMLAFLWFHFGCVFAFILIFIPNSLAKGHYGCTGASFIQFTCNGTVENIYI